MATKATKQAPAASADERAQTAVAALEKLSTKHDFANMARFGITSEKAMGVSVANIRKVAKDLGRDHDLAGALWKTGWYEARMLTAFVDEPDRVTPAQMDRWCRDFDSWGICDTLCFHLFDRTPHAWAKVEKWNDDPREFVKRASYALIASIAGHDKASGDEPFLRSLPWIERAASDDRNFVKKGVSWALRGLGRRNARLYDPAMEVANRLAVSSEPAARWVGRDALRDLVKHPPKKSRG